MHKTTVIPTEPTKTTNDKAAAILFVDDEDNVLKALRRLFHHEHYVTYFASSGAEGLAVLRQNPVDLIISDMRMPEMNGAEFLAQVVMQWPETIRILLTGNADLESTIAAINKGRIYNYCNKPWNDEELKVLVHDALEQKRLLEKQGRLSAFISQRNKALKELNQQLEEKVDHSSQSLKNSMQNLDLANKSLTKHYNNFIRIFSRNIEMRPGIKNGQSKYIVEKALLITQQLGLSTEDRKNIIYAGLLLQIGKISLPDNLLAEPFDAMSPANKLRYCQHAVEGEALLNEFSQLKTAAILIRHQYERYNGLGCPDGLSRQKIPLGSRILTVVSDYVAYLDGSMTGEVMSVKDVINKLMIRKGSYYDPDIIDAFVKLLKEELTVEVIPPAATVITKSWKNSRIGNNLKTNTENYSIIEISCSQLKPGMDIEYVYFDNKPYIRNAIANQDMIDNISALIERSDKHPIIKIRLPS
ncbi:HD domain-containing phosphohydrolase [Methylobacter sp. G7]|uniref:HD domain-containing phosphohydrolase n=1 Tax=Methylobacter sp. G7 TaxID=3230117 RepID=UPI003D804A8D